ncbi:MAG: PQQ-binding-like beta-propeller repeat protein [Bacteroidales bacterium]|jgi:outer membrane protein assembly factor BamB|nr:PQQ-binding-like beta-propeller repeat protein [Bacteroidales bacterium]
MKIKPHIYVPYILIFIGFASIAWWVSKDPVKDLYVSKPGMDNRGKGVAENFVVSIGEFFERFEKSKSNLTETWPRFRGEYLDNISRSPVALIDKFPEAGPNVKWEVHLGEGHGGAAIYEGKVYILDYDEDLRSDMLRCFDLVNGTELWRRWYKIPIKRNHGMSRTVPAVTEDYIVTIGPRGHVMCVNRLDGELRWGLNVEKDYGSEVPFWYTGQCPLVDEGRAIIATGGKNLLIAVDCNTGEIAWQTPNAEQWGMSHSSIMPYVYKGVKMYVYSAIGGACGILAEGPDAGKILWMTNEWKHNVVAPSPVCMPDGKIFLTAGYGAGAMVLQLTESAGGFTADVVQEYLPKEGLACEQQTPVVFQGHLLGILPKDAGPFRNQLICVHPNDFTKVIWSSGSTVRFGLGPYMIADNKIFILSDDGTLTIATPSISEYIQLDSYRVIEDGADAWAPLAVADGYMVLRDSEKMICIDMAKSRN